MMPRRPDDICDEYVVTYLVECHVLVKGHSPKQAADKGMKVAKQTHGHLAVKFVEVEQV